MADLHLLDETEVAQVLKIAVLRVGQRDLALADWPAQAYAHFAEGDEGPGQRLVQVQRVGCDPVAAVAALVVVVHLKIMTCLLWPALAWGIAGVMGSGFQ